MEIVQVIILCLISFTTGLFISLSFLRQMVSKKVAQNFKKHQQKMQDNGKPIESQSLEELKIKLKAEQRNKLRQNLQNNSTQNNIIQKQNIIIKKLSNEINQLKTKISTLKAQEHTFEALPKTEKGTIEDNTKTVTSLSITNQSQNFPEDVIPKKDEQKALKDTNTQDDNTAEKASFEPKKPHPATPRPALSEVVQSLDAEDNLQEIKGIGKILHDKLNQEGIRSFQDLSVLTDDEIQELYQKTKIFPSRLRTWRKQAQNLLNESKSQNED